MPFDQQEFEVLRSADAAPGGPLPAHNRIGDDDPVLRRLIEGRALVFKGWCKKTLRDIHGNVCALGAIYRDGEVHRAGPARGAHEALEKIVGRAQVAVFNNAPETTRADVLWLFDRAIAARKSALDPSRSL